jgi:hypothetical protein
MKRIGSIRIKSDEQISVIEVSFMMNSGKIINNKQDI